MKTLGSIGSFLWALVLVLLAFICMGNSFKQELWFYDAQNNGLHFQSQVANTSVYSTFFPQVTRVCTKGTWTLFNSENFQSLWEDISNSSVIVCAIPTSVASIKSLRHLGATDTDTDALSLYEGSNYSGKELFVTSEVQVRITAPIRSFVGTGTSKWMLFEGQALNGKSFCFEVPSPGWFMSSGSVSSIGLTTIGSVFRGCDLQEIQSYKMLYDSLFVNSII